MLCENVRFRRAREADDPLLAQRMAALCDVFVMDAFGTAHRAQASTNGVALGTRPSRARDRCLSRSSTRSSARSRARRPLVAIIGGSKVSTKIEVLQSLIAKVDELIVGGGIANTILAASGVAVGKSLSRERHGRVRGEPPAGPGESGGDAIPMPTDVVVAREFAATAEAVPRARPRSASDEMILDIGPRRPRRSPTVANAGTIVWNGPLGVFENPTLRGGTKTLAEAIAKSPAFSIAGGGDTLAAIEQFGIEDEISYISTGGGAFLEFLEGKKLPAVAALERRAAGG